MADAAELRKEPPAEQFDEFLHKQAKAAVKFNPALNIFPEPYFGGEALKKWHKKNNNAKEAETISDRQSAHLYTVKSNSPDAYYDGSVSARRLRRLRKLRK